MSKINSGTILLGFLAILFGLIGTWAFKEYSKKPAVPSQSISAPEKIVVPMASRTLEPGHQIKIDDIALVRLSREELRDYGFDKGFMSNAAQIVGKTVKTEILRGKTFDTRDFFPEGTGPGIADRLKPGQRAITVSLTPTNALIGFAGAGQTVDVLFHYGEQRKVASEDNEAQAANGGGHTEAKQFYQSATVTLVQSAEILALGNRAVPTGDANGISAQDRVLVTLAVSPTDAEAIRVADGNGELSLSLRNSTDQTAVELGKPKTLSEIIQIDPGVHQMEVYRGSKLTTVEFKTPRGGPPQGLQDRPGSRKTLRHQPAEKTLKESELNDRGSGDLEASMVSSETLVAADSNFVGAYAHDSPNSADTNIQPLRSLLDARRPTRASTQFGVR